MDVLPLFRYWCRRPRYGRGRKMCAALGSVGMLLICGAVRAQALTRTPGDLLDAAAAATRWGDRYASVVDVKYRAKMGQGMHQSVVGNDSVVKMYHDGARQDMIVSLLGYVTPEGTYVARAGRREILLDHGTRTYWWFPANAPHSGSVQVARSAERVRAMALIDQADPRCGAFLDGFVDGLGNIVDIAKQGAVSRAVRQETMNEIPCQVVESVTSTGRATVWIAPSEGNNIVKYILEERTDIEGPMRAEFEATAFENLDGRIVIRAGRSERSWIDSTDISKWEETVEADRVGLDLHPDFKAANLFTTADIPNGLRCTLDDMPNVGVDFVWMNGQAVVKVDDDLFTGLAASVQKTAAGEVAQSALVSSTAEANPLPDEGRGRMKQLYLALCSVAAIAMSLLLGMYARRGDVHGVR